MGTAEAPPDPAVVDRILAFLTGIGLTVEERPLTAPTFLPGISIEAGTMVIDRARLSHPGDLLHEAGHLAVLPAAERPFQDDRVGDDGGMEMGAIAWSFAALVHLGLPIELLFHPHGYKGGAAALCENFQAGRYIGVPILEWRGLTGQPAATYPAMSRWLCD